MITKHSSFSSLLFSLLFIASILLSGCATQPKTASTDNIQVVTSEQRVKQLLKNKDWQLKGKIAFIQQTKETDKRESASIMWQVNENKHTQELNLTSFLGINVLHLKSNKKQHLIKVDGKEYRDADLSNLIYSLTGLTLPTEALTFWLKGLPYSTDDELQFDKKTQLPKSMSSYYHNAIWQISYNDYRRFNGINMATKLTIEKEDLLIKVAVKNWSFIN
tara:strand:+ start:12382 stop:13038 length:657 start_codon:yes stop_codon:yes gene_type:complete